jgi:hypothetical protein
VPDTVGVTAFDGSLVAEPPSSSTVTVKVYSVSFVRPVTVIGLDDPVAVIPSGLDVTVKVGDAPYVT